ncbi:unnamed protein product [Eruca vesicaria subsp. sativa]|uniref:Gnk2-homologous domain-containing protein n=1 Tax=Eruca vesicaria subsp. sativa TaxID=29727 RepID=A0ABC8LRY1_ERUVS|nr:unnamed protein product [Eruca vesicaria subsp. sativa]
MYSLSSVLKRLILIHVLATQLLHINSELSLNTTNAYLNHKCLVSQGKYKPGSEYEKLLKLTIKNFYFESGNKEGFTLSGSTTGFSAIHSDNKEGFTLSGSSSFSAILQCRGDSYGSKCRDCFATAAAALSRRCPWYKGKIIWYDQCLLSISPKYSIGQIDYDNNFCMFNAKKLGWDFLITWVTFMDNLTTLATTGDNRTLYYAGKKQLKDDMLYGMVQCTKDLNTKACEECLMFNSVHFQDCLNFRRGARFVSRSCTFRFEFYPFIAKSVHII